LPDIGIAHSAAGMQSVPWPRHCSMEDVMRTFDLSPLFRSTVGFDHLARMLDAAARLDDQTVSYPPYNIEKLDEDHYRITMAVAGFAEGDLELTAQGQTLVITGRAQKDEANTAQLLHRGIAGRSFNAASNWPRPSALPAPAW